VGGESHDVRLCGQRGARIESKREVYHAIFL